MSDNNRSSRTYDVAVIHSLTESMASQEPIQWASQYLTDTLKKHLTVGEFNGMQDGIQAELFIVISDGESSLAGEILQNKGAALPDEPESLALAGGALDGRKLLLAAGRDTRGLVYALLELADRVNCAADPLGELSSIDSLVEKPANAVRSVTRLFSNEVEDKPWFYDRTFWDEYLTELATQRFNRFSFGTGLGYDYGNKQDYDLRDNYLCFIYPFLLSIPGYEEVRAQGLSEEERGKNLETLLYIGEQTRRRGLQFHLGLWNHAYVYPYSPRENYKILGLDANNYAAYCRDALKHLLEVCPAVDGITLRAHSEGGDFENFEDSQLFWSVLVDGATQAGRPIEIDLHGKGINHELIKVPVKKGLPTVVSPKYWAEHMGPPYHQAAIRKNEFNRYANNPENAAITEASRRFTRYGYADYLRDDRKYDVLFRIWPGTQRLLLWGDPAMAAGYGRYTGIGGALGLEWCEPLSFKARKNSGSPGGRETYADESLQLGNRDWQKHRYTYRLWGRLLYDPDASPESWRRYLRAEFGTAAEALEQALAYASRILPFITIVHHPAGANNNYWPEMYHNLQSVRNETTTSPYDRELPEPKTFGASETLDSALFYGVDEFADALLQGSRSGKYSPLQTADRLEALAAAAETFLAEAKDKAGDPEAAEFRRAAVDIAVMAGTGHFFAQKFRAGLAYSLFERTKDGEFLRRALEFYDAARGAWQKLVDASRGVYRDDITFGVKVNIRGNWADRLKPIDEDIAAMEQIWREFQAAAAAGDFAAAQDAAAASEREPAGVPLAATAVFSGQGGEPPVCRHTPPSSCRKGEAVAIAAEFPEADAGLLVRLHYRHANQSEHYETAEMTRGEGGNYAAEIPASYTDSPYPLIYFFEAHNAAGEAWMLPGLDADLSNQPYYMIDPA